MKTVGRAAASVFSSVRGDERAGDVMTAASVFSFVSGDATECYVDQVTDGHGKCETALRRLTLPPSSCLGETKDAGGSDQQKEEDRRMLGRESMARITDIAIMASEGTITRPHVHGSNLRFDPNSGRLQMRTQALIWRKMKLQPWS
jgi:hypothetical protein